MRLVKITPPAEILTQLKSGVEYTAIEHEGTLYVPHMTIQFAGKEATEEEDLPKKSKKAAKEAEKEAPAKPKKKAEKEDEEEDDVKEKVKDLLDQLDEGDLNEAKASSKIADALGVDVDDVKPIVKAHSKDDDADFSDTWKKLSKLSAGGSDEDEDEDEDAPKKSAKGKKKADEEEEYSIEPYTKSKPKGLDKVDPEDLEEGDKVVVQWKEGGDEDGWYSATVTKLGRGGKVFVKFDADGNEAALEEDINPVVLKVE